MTQNQLEDYLWGAAKILRGMIDSLGFKQYIFPLLFFKRFSGLWNEEFELAKEESGGNLEYAEFTENHRFQIPEGCQWKMYGRKPLMYSKPQNCSNYFAKFRRAFFMLLGVELCEILR